MQQISVLKRRRGPIGYHLETFRLNRPYSRGRAPVRLGCKTLLTEELTARRGAQLLSAMEQIAVTRRAWSPMLSHGITADGPVRCSRVSM